MKFGSATVENPPTRDAMGKGANRGMAATRGTKKKATPMLDKYRLQKGC